MTNREKWEQALTGLTRNQATKLFFKKELTEKQREKLWILWGELNKDVLEKENPLEFATDPEWWKVEKKTQSSLL